MSVDDVLAEKYRFREAMVDALRGDLVGPGEGDDEVIGEAPLSRYIIGALWPQPADEEDAEATEQAAEAEPTGAEADGESDEGSPVAESRMRFPSSVGLTFSVRASAESVVIAPSAGRYEELTDDDEAALGWRRHEVPAKTFAQQLQRPGVYRDDVADGLQLYRYVRPERDGVVTVTVALKNTHTAIKGDLRDGISWFQVGIAVQTQHADIVDRSAAHNIGVDPDLDTAALMLSLIHI